MAIKALTGLSPEWYEPERETTDKNGSIIPVDLPEDVIPTQFQIRPLTGLEYMEVVETPGMASLKKAFRYGLQGWRNLKDENGNDIEFDQVTAGSILPARWIIAIGRRVVKISSFDGEKVKNS